MGSMGPPVDSAHATSEHGALNRGLVCVKEVRGRWYLAGWLMLLSVGFVVFFLAVSAAQAQAATCGKGEYLKSGKCVKAERGHFSTKKSDRQKECRKGTFQNRRGQARCTKARPGRFAPKKGMNKDRLCKAGNY